MNINATLIGQSITFFFFVWFCMKFVWPQIMQALEARKKQIADGLAAGERGKHEQELAQKRAAEVLHEAKQQAQEIIAKAEKRAAEIVDEAKTDAKAKASASWWRHAPRSVKSSIVRRKVCALRWCLSPSPVPAKFSSAKSTHIRTTTC